MYHIDNSESSLTYGFHRATTSSILSILYDLPTVYSADDSTVTIVNRFAEQLVDYANPGNYLVEFFPWMLHIPSSLAKWKREAKEGFKYYSEFFLKMFHDVENRIASSICFLFGTLLLKYSSGRTKGMNAIVSLEN